MSRTFTPRRLRSLAATGVLVGAALFLTACDPDGEAVTGVSAETGTDSAGKTPKADAGNRADGTVTGNLTYLAPGKLEVDGRPFWLTEDTEIWGTGGICGTGEGHSPEECTTEELESAAKEGDMTAEVVIEKGMAVKVTDQYVAGGGEGSSEDGDGADAANRADGTVTGNLTYLAPGKFEVDGRPFWLTEDTEIWGAGGICGTGEGQVADECTAEELENAAKEGGVTVEVTIEKGMATRIAEA
ncbi:MULTISPECIES: hypothetical protein [unclassified Streptomyces]|uniref:hypothetical protein n=1 Tax=unclassified Streptomyces TaxID=2593676 RepID=UPI000B0C6CC5|nr:MULTISPECIES: hypothetical protein [unclassified Streptomyces]AZM59424.1 hypothetical protein DLM49_07490 [Streptomyces sp. WAC 01438]RSM94069.1 hypothetical protein DMA10_19150 [Streptomyces sp. WAC 01420]